MPDLIEGKKKVKGKLQSMIEGTAAFGSNVPSCGIKNLQGGL